MKIQLLAMALVFVSAGAWAEGAQFSGTSNLVVRTVNGHAQIEKTETRYLEDFDKNLFKFTAHTVRMADTDGETQDGLIEAFTTKNSLYDTPSWTRKVAGADLSVFSDEFVQVNEYGCCDSPTINRLINKKTGNEVEAALNNTAFEVQVPNSKLPSRYLAQVKDSKAPAKRNGKSYIGTISYFDGQAIKGRVRVYAALPDGWGADFYDLQPVLTGKNQQQGRIVTLWSSNFVTDAAKAFSAFGVTAKISWEDHEESFTVMVNGDRIDIQQSTASSDLEFETL